MELNKFSSEHVKNEVITITSEHPYSNDNFERSSNPSFLHLVKVKTTKRRIDIVQGEKSNGTKQVIIKTHLKYSPYSQLWTFIFWILLWKKFQAKFDKSDQVFEHPEEELINFMGKPHQELKQIEEELVPLNSETPYLSEATEVLNERSVKLPSKFLISKIPASFDDNFKHLSMNSRIEAAKIKPKTTFEKTIHDIKDDLMKVISFSSMHLSDITLFNKNFEQISMKRRIEVSKFKPEQKLENTINEIKDDHLKSIDSAYMNISAITSFDDNFE